jgi:hypothetical protein
MSSYSGTPLVVDEDLRSLLSIGRWGFGVTLGLLLAWLGLDWWVPAPLLVATIAMEGWLLVRSDRAVRLDVHPDRVVVDDRFAPRVTVGVEQIVTCSLLHRRRGDAFEMVIVLGSERGVLLAVAAQGGPPRADSIDVDAIDALLGAGGGLLRSFAAPPRAVRQRFADPKVIDALVAFAPEAARGRGGLRLWRGAAPELTVFGMHAQPADAWLILDGGGAKIVAADGQARSTLDGEPRFAWAEREASLLHGEGEEAATRLPMLCVHWPSGTQIAVPAPAASGAEVTTHLDHPSWHTHAAEGAILLSWLAAAGYRPEPPPVQRAPASDTSSDPLGAPPE